MRAPAYTLPESNQLPLICFLLSMLLAGIAVANPLGISEQLLDAVAKEYGRRARARVLSWQHLVESSQGQSEREKLERVNNFFNRIRFVADEVHWKKLDYWATPVELIATKGGDCEDFAIAKYITLRALNVPDEKLRITYVKALELNQAHMVLTFYANPGSVPDVLDNLDAHIKPATQRKDLQPVYSFNGSGLWLTKTRGKSLKLGAATDLNMWRDLIARLQQQRTTT